MAEELLWVARYPTPKKSEKFDNFYDKVLEKHIVRSRSGNVYSTRVNSDTFSDFKNYSAIWKLALIEFES